MVPSVSPRGPRGSASGILAQARIEPMPGLRAWTDDFDNLFSVLK
jgi:hypothetical protein